MAYGTSQLSNDEVGKMVAPNRLLAPAPLARRSGREGRNWQATITSNGQEHLPARKRLRSLLLSPFPGVAVPSCHQPYLPSVLTTRSSSSVVYS